VSALQSGYLLREGQQVSDEVGQDRKTGVAKAEKFHMFDALFLEDNRSAV
jgi:hypothetical protein